MNLSYLILMLWGLFEGLNDWGALPIDPKVRGLMLLLFFLFAALEGLGVLNVHMPALRRKES